MASIHGELVMHRILTEDGRDAIMLVPDDGAEPLLYVTDEASPLTLERVEGRKEDPNSYLTISRSNGDKIHLGPYSPREIIQ